MWLALFQSVAFDTTLQFSWTLISRSLATTPEGLRRLTVRTQCGSHRVRRIGFVDCQHKEYLKVPVLRCFLPLLPTYAEGRALMAASSILSCSFPETDIAVLTINDPDKGANVLSPPVLEELAAQLDQLEARDDLAGLVICSGKPGNYIAGADLRQFVAWIDAPAEQITEFCRLGQQLFQRLAASRFVTVAAIDGVCLGGGAELALWCDRRILTSNSKTQYGFPEVKVGLYPGWGGTARTPRIVGLSNAVEMITSGESISPADAYAMGLATDVVEPEALEAAAIGLIRSEHQSGAYLKDRERWAAPIEISDTELGFLGATASSFIQGKTKGNYPSPLVALEIMLGCAGTDVQAACEAEAEQFPQVFGSPVNRSLLNVFFLQDRNKKDTGVAQDEVAVAPIKSVSVIGAGVMGQGIAAANVRRKIPATITDTSREALAAGVSKVLDEVSYNREIKGPDVKKAVEMAPAVNGSTSLEEVAASDLVIEAVVERLEVKQQVYAGLEPLMRPDAILASNTSTIPITTLAEGLARPEQFVGIHFFNPVRKMPLVEIIRGQQTSDATIASAVAYAKAIGKTPVVVGDGPGFLVNRLLLPYMNESLELVCEGASIREVEQAAKAFGMPMGPITLFDVVGIDVALFAGAVMHEAFPERIVASRLLQAMHAEGRLGQKSGAGFFSYQGTKKGRGKPDPETDRIIETCRTATGSFTAESLQMRMFLPMLLEATRVIEAGLVRDPRDVDLGLIFGIGFPPFKGGLLAWADTLGAEQVVAALEPFQEVGPRYQPTQMLLDMAQQGGKFYD